MKLHLTFSAERRTLTVSGETVLVKPYQIVLWVSLSIRERLDWDSRTPKFPALLDTGHNHNFSISEEHLVTWAGLDPVLLEKQRELRDKGKKIPVRAAGLWLHSDKPFPLNLDEGIAVHSDAGPRLPLLGLRALTHNNLRAFVFADKYRAVLRTRPKWYWPF